MVVFDLCGTLYSVNTTFAFLRYIKPVYSFFIFSLPARLVNKFVYKVFKFELIRYLALKGLRGYSESQLINLSESFFDDVLVGKELDEVVQLLNIYKKRAVIVSASIEPIVKVVSDRLGVGSYLASRLSYEDGFATGSLALDMLGNKVLHVPAKLEFVVTDNRSDLGLVLISNRAVILSNKNNLFFWRKNIRPQDKIIETL